MSRPRWILRRSPTTGRWFVRRSDRRNHDYFDTWSKALKHLQGMISRWAIANVLDRAVATPGECEALHAALVTGDNMLAKRQRIAWAARMRKLPLWIYEEVEDDPSDTLFLVQVRGKKRRRG